MIFGSRNWSFLSCAGLLVLAIFVVACDTGSAPSLYDPDSAGEPDPSIATIDPAGAALAGVDVVTISGSNFSTDASRNLVYFGDTRGEVLEATATQLRVRAPNTPAPSLDVRVSVLGAENFSNLIAYSLEPATERVSDIKNFEELFSITSASGGEILSSLFSDGLSVGIVRIAPNGDRSLFASTTFKWDDMRIGTDGLLYTVRGVRAIFRFAEGGAQQTWVVLPDNAAVLRTMAFDAAGNLFVGGPNASIYRVATDQSVSSYAFAGDVKKMLVSGGFLYAAATTNDQSQVVRFPIDANGDLGAVETYFDVSAFNGSEARALAVAASGDLFVGTDAEDPIVVVRPDQTAEALYPGILMPAAISLAWGSETFLYMVQGSTDETQPDLVRINTRQQGAG